jgi:hypothetical protein
MESMGEYNSPQTSAIRIFRFNEEAYYADKKAYRLL